MNRHTYNQNDEIVELENSVKSIRGFGDLGTYRGIYDFEDTDLSDHGHQVCRCEYCGYDRVIITQHVNPEFPEALEYECANPECKWSETEELSDEILEQHNLK